MKKIALLLAQGFEEVEAVTPVDYLRRAGIEVQVAGIGGTVLKGAHGLSVGADLGVEDLSEDLDGVVIPGGLPGASNVAASKEAQVLIQVLHRRGALVAAICASPAFVLAPLGILEGKKATCYPGCEGDLTGAEFSTRRVVRDGNVITSRGPGTAAEFSLEIIRYLAGEAKAAEVSGQTLQK
ncbi:MAG: DJ-1/PfpI family protein [Spirochaetales bacterium]|nr:DJ-1/PfpI family protein [Spirochaetales bacterium]